jgi:hypothetical protein
MAHEFEEFALNGHNYSTWTMDVKITLALRGMYEVIVPPTKREHALPTTHQYNALYIIRHHIYPNLKSEYVQEEESSVIWTALQNCYEQ